MARSMSMQKRRWIAILIVIAMAILAILAEQGQLVPALWLLVVLTLAVLVTMISLGFVDGVLGGPRFRKVRLFNPASKVLKRVKIQKKAPDDQPPPPPPDPPLPDWPSPDLIDVPPNPPFGQPPVVNMATFDKPFDIDAKRLEIEISTDPATPPVLTATFEVRVPDQANNEFIHELDILTYEVGGALKGTAWAWYGSNVNTLLQKSPDVSFDID